MMTTLTATVREWTVNTVHIPHVKDIFQTSEVGYSCSDSDIAALDGTNPGTER